MWQNRSFYDLVIFSVVAIIDIIKIWSLFENCTIYSEITICLAFLTHYEFEKCLESIYVRDVFEVFAYGYFLPYISSLLDDVG